MTVDMQDFYGRNHQEIDTNDVRETYLKKKWKNFYKEKGEKIMKLLPYSESLFLLYR